MRVSHRGSAIEEGGILTITIGLFFENNMLLFSIAILAILQGGFGGMFSEFRCPPPSKPIEYAEISPIGSIVIPYEI